MTRITSQRQVILDYLRSVKTHPSAEMIFAAARKKMPRISLGTVYRNLEALTKEGRILEINTEKKRFDGSVHNHLHFICKKCQRIFDLDIAAPWVDLKKKFAKIGKMEACQICGCGLCKQCQKK